MRKFFNCILSLLFVSCFAFADSCLNQDFSNYPNGDIQLAPTSHHRMMGFEAHIPNPSQPTLIVMPGVYRGAISSDTILQELSKRGINWVSVHLSTQPMAIDRGQTREATFGDITTSVLRNEVLALVKSLCIQNPIYVGLSFSGTLSTGLTPSQTSLVFEATPMGTFTDGLPDGGLSYDIVNFWYSFNPMTAPGWDAMKEANYRIFWRQAINQYIERYPNLAADSKLMDVAVSGYTSMSKSIEYYDFRKTDFVHAPRQVFIFAEKEDDGRRQVQLEGLDLATKAAKGIQPLTFILLGSTHNILVDAPIAWAASMDFVLKGQPAPQNVALVQTDGKMTWLTPQQWAIKRLELLKNNNQAPVVP